MSGESPIMVFHMVYNDFLTGWHQHLTITLLSLSTYINWFLVAFKVARSVQKAVKWIVMFSFPPASGCGQSNGLKLTKEHFPLSWEELVKSLIPEKSCSYTRSNLEVRLQSSGHSNSYTIFFQKSTHVKKMSLFALRKVSAFKCSIGQRGSMNFRLKKWVIII